MNWDEFIDQETKKDYFISLGKSLAKDSKEHTIYPEKYDTFNIFDKCPIEKIKVVILGQDPYHGPGQAHGFAFSVQKGVPIPPSLKNIYKEIKSDLHLETPFEHGCLTGWVEQGVFLLNSTLTVRAGAPGSHKDYGWERFTNAAISVINKIERPIVFMLWGAQARSKRGLIYNKNHFVLEAPHPSPLSAHTGFFGCKHFSKANDFLFGNDIAPIDWSIK